MFDRALMLPSSGQTHKRQFGRNMQPLFDLQTYVQ